MVTENIDFKRMSVNRAAQALGVRRQTLTDWLENEGAPFVERADRDGGKAWVVSLPDLIAWKEGRAADTATKKLLDKLGVEEPGQYDPEADPEAQEKAKLRKLIAEAGLAELKLQEAQGLLIPSAAQAAVVREEYALVRSAFLQLGPGVAPKVADMEDPLEIGQAITDDVNRILLKLKADKDA